MRLLLLPLLMIFSSCDGPSLERLTLTNLSLDYLRPYGKGEVEKVSIDFSAKNDFNAPYPVELFRTDENFELKSEYFDVTWIKPWSFIHNISQFSIIGTYADFGRKDHSARARKITLGPNSLGKFILSNLLLKCVGNSEHSDVEFRIIEDCHKKLDLTIEDVDVSINSMIAKIMASIPQQQPLNVEDRPIDNMTLKVNEGNFHLSLYTKVVFYAGLRAWGNLSFKNNYEFAEIRIDQIKFGYISITPIVMRELRKRIKHPDVEISGNTIKIKLYL
jgi:hypothetical protein